MIRNFFIYRRAKKAIREIRLYLTELEEINSTSDGNIWKDKVITSFTIYFGENAEISKRLEKTYFTVNNPQVLQGVVGIFDNYVFTPVKKERFRSILNSAIQLIEHNGIKRDYVGSNFLKSFNDEVVIGLVLAIIAATFTITSLVSDKDDKKMESELADIKAVNEKLTDSIVVLLKEKIEDYRSHGSVDNKKPFATCFKTNYKTFSLGPNGSSFDMTCFDSEAAGKKVSINFECYLGDIDPSVIWDATIQVYFNRQQVYSAVDDGIRANKGKLFIPISDVVTIGNDGKLLITIHYDHYSGANKGRTLHFLNESRINASFQ